MLLNVSTSFGLATVEVGAGRAVLTEDERKGEGDIGEPGGAEKEECTVLDMRSTLRRRASVVGLRPAPGGKR